MIITTTVLEIFFFFYPFEKLFLLKLKNLFMKNNLNFIKTKIINK